MTGLNICRKPYVCAGANSKGAAEEELENLNRKAAFYIYSVPCKVFPYPGSGCRCRLWSNVTETR